jgi:hypothetical protein
MPRKTKTTQPEKSKTAATPQEPTVANQNLPSEPLAVAGDTPQRKRIGPPDALEPDYIPPAPKRVGPPDALEPDY